MQTDLICVQRGLQDTSETMFSLLQVAHEAPLAVLFFAHNVPVARVLAHWPHEATAEVGIAHCVQLAGALSADGVGLVADSYVTTQPGTRPSQDPGGREAIVSHGLLADGTTTSAVLFYGRDDAGVLFPDRQASRAFGREAGAPVLANPYLGQFLPALQLSGRSAATALNRSLAAANLGVLAGMDCTVELAPEVDLG